jgi:hypothetical protein
MENSTKERKGDIYGHGCKNGHGYCGEKYASCPVCGVPNWENLTPKEIDRLRVKPLKEYFSDDPEGFNDYCSRRSEEGSIYRGLTFEDVKDL